jgi:hypothetical protein
MVCARVSRSYSSVLASGRGRLFASKTTLETIIMSHQVGKIDIKEDGEGPPMESERLSMGFWYVNSPHAIS